MTLDRLTNAQLEVLVDRLARHADQAWQRLNASRTWLCPADQRLVARAQVRDRIYSRADNLLYDRYAH